VASAPAPPHPPSPPLQAVEPDFTEYLRDESRLIGHADRIAFPKDEEQVRELLRRADEERTAVTVQGGRTGITGGAVPQGGLILNLSRMDRLLGVRWEEGRGSWLLNVQPGLPLEKLNAALASEELPGAPASFRTEGPFFFPPDPTETGATLGGMASTNASGACSLRYGPTRRYVEALHLVLADGSLLALRRGMQRAHAGRFRLTIDSGRTIEGELPRYRWPEIKNAAGLYVHPDMDLLDLAVGSEGTLGVITELELLLARRPARIWALLAFFLQEPAALRFMRAARAGIGGLQAAALEFFDRRSLALLAEQKRTNPAFAELPEVPEMAAAIYVEYHSEQQPSEERAEGELAAVAEALERFGSDSGKAWSAEGERELERLKLFRHALPEAVNLTIDRLRLQAPGITKLGTDMAVPAEALEPTLGMYHRDLDAGGFEHVLFGHIGDNHIHVNILPRTEEEYRRGRELAERWADQVTAAGGTVSAEHGVGKLKVELLRKMYGSDSIDEMRRLIELFNPGRRLNRGNMVE
jgi:D-lactate dehydrogenase (cytochrome)